MQISTSQDFGAVIGKLANDDLFREQVKADPVAAFASVGITLDPSQVPAACELPSKEIMTTDMAAYYSKLDGKAAMVLFMMSGRA